MSQAVGRFRESKARGLEPTYPDAQFAVRPAMFAFAQWAGRGLSDNRSSSRASVLAVPSSGNAGLHRGLLLLHLHIC